jgi:hypothetical protein
MRLRKRRFSASSSPFRRAAARVISSFTRRPTARSPSALDIPEATVHGDAKREQRALDDADADRPPPAPEVAGAVADEQSSRGVAGSADVE